MKADHDRLRYVTRLLGSEPALNTALLGALIFFTNAEEIWRWPSGWWTLVAALAWLAFLVGVLRFYIPAYERWIPEYYQRRFGSVEAARKQWSKWDAIFFLVILALLFIGWPIAHYAGSLGQLHMMISDPGRQINLWPSVLWMALLCTSLRLHMRGIERQRLYFLLAGLIAFAAIVFYAISHPDAKRFVWWKVLNAGSLGLSLIVLGLYDHISLVLLLPKKVAEGDDE